MTLKLYNIETLIKCAKISNPGNFSLVLLVLTSIFRVTSKKPESEKHISLFSNIANDEFKKAL
jgi:hypothetical protein